MFGASLAASKAPKMSGMRPIGGQSAYKAPRPPMGMATRPPIIANKARGTQSSSMYRSMPNALGASMMF